jgi:GDP/UDP-N,N'-diacetylbacillosamine 2-epimerase (hydrolysing)
MKKKVRIHLFTTSRAEFALVNHLLHELKKNKIFIIKLIVGGTHSLKNYGKTIEEVKDQGHKIFKILKSFKSNDDPKSIVNYIKNDISEINNIFDKSKIDYVVIFGDRYETLSIVINSIIYQKKIIHVGGGEITKGVIDDQIRNIITKAAYYHFTASEFYKKRIINMGENPINVHNVGALNVDVIKNIEKLNKNSKIWKKFNLNYKDKFCLMTLHPANLEENFDSSRYLKNIFRTLDHYNLKVIITYPNLEIGSNKIINFIRQKIKKNSKYRFVKSLGYKRYNQLIKKSEFLIGNSSSGIYEAPYHKIPTINLGERQKGRLMHSSIINCNNNYNNIKDSVDKALSEKFKKKISKMKYLFGGGSSSKKIVKILSKLK